jgi:hypothetical protein
VPLTVSSLARHVFSSGWGLIIVLLLRELKALGSGWVRIVPFTFVYGARERTTRCWLGDELIIYKVGEELALAL